MIGARVIGATPGMGTKSVLIDRGSASGVRRQMAVVTPDGIVGKVIAVFPFASQVLSVTDPGFAAGVESQKNHVHGVLKGLGNGTARVDYVPTGQKVEVGEMFYTSGEDRVFPKGLPVGKVTSVHEGGNFQEITVQPSGAEAAPEEVLVILDPVHQAIPEEATAETPVFLAPDVKPEGIRAIRRRNQAQRSLKPINCRDAIQENRRRAEARVRSGRTRHTAAELQPESPRRQCTRRARRRHGLLRAGQTESAKRECARCAGRGHGHIRPAQTEGSTRRADRLQRRYRRASYQDGAARQITPHRARALMEYPVSSRIMVDSARQVRSTSYPVWVYFAVPLLALLIQVYLPLFETLRFISLIELPLLVTIYFALMRRSQLRGLAIGVVLGLAQDSLFQQQLGMYGICKTLVGYFSASIGMQFDVEHALVRLVLCFIFYLFHQFFYWVLQRSLLDQPAVFQLQRELVLAAGQRRDRCHSFPLPRHAAEARMTSTKQVFQLYSGAGLFVPVLHDHRRVNRNAPVSAGPDGDGARTGDHHRAFRDQPAAVHRSRGRSCPRTRS